MVQRKYILLAAVFVASVTADQVGKYLAVARLTKAFEVDVASSPGARLAHFLGDRHLDGDVPGGADLRLAPVAVLENFWHFRYVENPGAAWGVAGQLPPGLRLPFFHLVSIAAVGFILYFYRRLRDDQRYLQVAFALVLGGAVGNYLDRMIRGYVIDFIDWHWYQGATMHWPTFNIADAAICVGVGMLLFENLVARKPAVPAAAAPQPEPVP